MAARSHGPGTDFWLCVHCDLELGNITLATNHDTPFGHGQPIWKILSISNMVRTRHEHAYS